jgi:hypothetical protein
MQFSGSPRIAKGAIVCIDLESNQQTYIILQYNPTDISRTITPKICGGSGEGHGKFEAMRIEGAPKEDITLKVMINAADQLAKGNTDAASMGIYPQLSALELLVYPSVESAKRTSELLARGEMEIFSLPAPLTLFHWGENRIVPVKITSLKIDETYHDAKLNPISADVTISMQVLSYNDLPTGHKGYPLFLRHQEKMESMATKGRGIGSIKF